MSAGTLTLTNNADAVTGSSTTFSTELAAGDFIVVTVGGVPYTLPVKAVNSNTSLTLVSNYTGPTQSGAAWSAVPRVALNMVTAALVAQSAEALRGLNYDKQNWQQFFTADGDVTITLPDTSQTTGPSAKKLINSVDSFTSEIDSIKTGLQDKAKKGSNSDITSLSGLTTALGIEYGGTGAKTAAAARTSFGLGTAATKNTGTNSGDVMEVGAFSLGSVLSSSPANGGLHPVTQFIRVPSSGSNNPVPGTDGVGINFALSSAYGFHLLASIGTTARIFGQSVNTNTGFGTRVEMYTTGNTTRASDGTLKAASPVARIVKSREENQRTDLYEAGFTWCGCGTANAEAEGISLTRLDVGVYLLVGSDGLASEGWNLLPPMDPGGMGELGVVEAEEAESGGITVKLYRRKYVLGDDGEIVKTKGEPIDVPVNSWIDIRLDMPKTSIWNQRQTEVQKILTEDGSENQQDA